MAWFCGIGWIASVRWDKCFPIGLTNPVKLGNRQAGIRFGASPSRLFCIALLVVLGCRDKTNSQPTVADPSTVSGASEQDGRVLPVFESRSSPRDELRADDWFETDSVSAKDVVYRDGQDAKLMSILESVGGGTAFCDYDGDGDFDLLFAGGGEIQVAGQVAIRGRPLRMLRNDGSGTFSLVTDDVGLGSHELYSHGCSVADFNSDGFPDLFVAGFGGIQLFRNEGDGTFAEIADASKLHCDRWQTSGTWVDVDRDGDLDLFVVTYVDWKPQVGERCINTDKIHDMCGPSRYAGQPDYLWRNNGDGTFEDISESAGISLIGRGFSAVAIDVNEDGWQDIYVANDVQENHLFLGDGPGHFREVGALWGCAYSSKGDAQGSMGIDAADVNGDGWPDLWVTNFTEDDNALYFNDRGQGYSEVSGTAGLAGVSWKWVGFGTGFADFDHDGWLDLVIANGHVQYFSKGAPYRQPAQLFRNQEGRFTEITSLGGAYFRVPHPGRGLAIGDYDNDGAEDVVIVHQNEPATLLRNRQAAQHWVRLHLLGTTSNRDAMGAKVTLNQAGREIVRWVHSGSGYLSTFDPRVLLPLFDDEAAAVQVHWPSGLVEEFRGLAQRQTHVLHEGRGTRR
jgi:hypothetical protein